MISINKILIIMAIIMLFTTSICATDKILGKLDGAEVSSLETSLPADRNAISLGTDLFPFNPYYNGIGVFLGYQYYITKNSSWEVIRFTYVYSIQTDLTNQLAEKYGVAPKEIERLFFVLKSNYKYYLSYGKSLLFDEYINIFRLGFIVGPGLAFTKKGDLFNTKFLANLGLSLEIYISDSLLWYFEFQDSITIEKEWITYPSFTLGLKKMF
jgi:hypothetical protein